MAGEECPVWYAFSDHREVHMVRWKLQHVVLCGILVASSSRSQTMALTVEWQFASIITLLRLTVVSFSGQALFLSAGALLR